ncbi:MAG: hypothetical protein IT580_24675, partial [Verrucomicrobiales bacterium]|nr:hypothetical protein [Verrucomicrobiales bacterium]
MEKTIRKRRTRLSRRLSKFRFFRVLNKDRGFAVVFLLLLAVVGLVVGGTLRWWSSSPAGHAGPVIRISGLDWLQAWSLRRSAQQLAREGKYDEALYTWRAAVARNLGDPELHRGILRHLHEALVPDPAHVVIVEASVQWLARLTRTNRTEIPLMAGVLERYTRPESGLAWADAQGGGSGVDDPVLRVRARCLLGAGQWEAFGRVWQGRPPGWDGDPELVLYGEAWRSATEEGAKGREAGERLRAAVNDSGRRGAVAARLLLYSAEKRSSVEDAQTAVARLVQLHGDTTMDHVRVWTLLAAAGRGEEARRLAREYRGTPLDAAGAARFVGTLLDLGLSREALDFLEAKIQGYGGSVEVWRAYFDALIKEARWSELRRACASARLLSGRQESLTGEVLFAELRAAVAAGRRGDGERVAPELALSTFATPARMVAAVSTLRESGYVEQAWSLLQRGR